MDLKTFKLDELNPAHYNPRKDLKPGDKEYEKIKNSIEAFGFVEPLIVNIRDGKNTIVGGHQRYKVLKELGVKDTKCVVVDYDEITEKACNVALNKIDGAFDYSSLADLLNEIDTGAIDMQLTGFDEDELARMMGWTEAARITELAEAIPTPEQLQDASEKAEHMVTNLSEALRELADKAPARLSDAKMIIMPKTRAKRPILVLDDSVSDVIIELQRYADAGQDSPLACLMAAKYPL